MLVACALVPRFPLVTALGERRALLGEPVALAPVPGGPQLLGEASGPAEAHGIRAGMRLGEAFSRCPELSLVAPDPERAERAWEGVLRALESIGAAVESRRPGEAFFEAEGMRNLWGGNVDGVLARAKRAIRAPARLAAAPSRFCAYAAAAEARSGRSLTIPPGRAREFLSPLPVALLRGHLDPPAARDDFPNILEQLGIRTLGELAGLPIDAVADRFGEAGVAAQRLAIGEDDRLAPRRRHETIAAELELPDAAAGSQLERALGLLVDRLLAHPGRRGRSIRALRLSARLAAGGGWRRDVVLRSAAATAERLRLVLHPCLSGLPRPAIELRLEAGELAPSGGDQLSLSRPEEERRRRLSEAVRQTRAAAGTDAVLRVLNIDVDSRIPERRLVLTPFPELDAGS